MSYPDAEYAAAYLTEKLNTYNKAWGHKQLH